tara:strand:+ start:81 stop:692 length:612 start_codon:yes stop_codon:yes gene_type:complete
LNSLLTIKFKGEGNYQIKGSKYYGFAYPIVNSNQVKFHLQNLKKKFLDASHICYAYRLLNNNNIDEFSTDAGEPRGSAGLPILNVLKSKQIINAAIFIVRYFGGSKLGIPGLIKSYSNATNNTLQKIILVNYVALSKIDISFEMKYNSRIEALIKEFNGIAIHKEFFSEVIFSISVPTDKKDVFLDKAHGITNGNVKIIKNSF